MTDFLHGVLLFIALFGVGAILVGFFATKAGRIILLLLPFAVGVLAMILLTGGHGSP